MTVHSITPGQHQVTSSFFTFTNVKKELICVKYNKVLVIHFYIRNMLIKSK